MAPQLRITRQNIFVIAFFVLLVGLLSLLLSLLEPFLRAFVWATLFAMVFHPIYSRLLKWTGGRNTVAALLSTLLVVVFLALPGFFITVNLGKEMPKAYAYLSGAQWNEKSLWLGEKLRALRIGDWLKPWGIDSSQSEAIIQKQVAATLQDLSQFVLDKLTYAFKNLPLFALELVFVCVALFFFFRDGSRLAFRVIELLPLEKEYQDKVAHTLSVTVTAVVRAIFLTALAQGFMTGLGFVIVGVPVPILLGLLAFVNSFIPFLGAASVWIPVTIWLFYQGQTGMALGLFIWGLVITVVDYVIKPWIIGSEAKLPLFWLFFTTIGGLKVYGVLGIFLGPIILSLGMAFLAIYREVYLNLRKPETVRPGHGR